MQKRSADGEGGRKGGLSAISATVFTGANAIRHLPINEHRRDGID